MKFEFSAGGVVFKKEKGEILFLLSKHSQNKSWGFPKGLIGDNNITESKEETAVREVKEETGVEATIVKVLGTTVYWYQWKGERVKKNVTYYLMECLSYDFNKRDHEMEEVGWFEVDKVEERLSFDVDKKLWRDILHEIKMITGF
jgi:8-oxo-dGTP diphosphatase